MSSSEEQSPPRQRGLPSIQQAREQRASGKNRWPSVKFWGYSALILAVGAILRWKLSQGEMESDRQKLLAMQRDVAQSEIGKRWTPFRELVAVLDALYAPKREVKLTNETKKLPVFNMTFSVR